VTETTKSYGKVVAQILNTHMPSSVLDAPCGSGWLRSLLNYDCRMDGMDLFAAAPSGYQLFRQVDLNLGLPTEMGIYDAIVCCEGIEHFGNPDLFFSTVRRHLSRGGLLVVTTPNTWYPEARLQYLLRGFFPSFPCLVGKIERGTHMHIMPWSFPQLYLYLSLTGFTNIAVHDVDEPMPKHLYEWLIGTPQYLYCARKQRKAVTAAERSFWALARSRASIYGRRLVVSAKSPSGTT
jgi:SAM-dependent methyltransferase